MVRKTTISRGPLAVTTPPATMQSMNRDRSKKSSVSWIWIGLAISLPIHAILLVILSSIGVGVGESTGNATPSFEVALIDADPLEPSADSSMAGGDATPEVRPPQADANSSDPSIFGLPDPTGNDQGDAAIVSAGAEGLFSTGGGGGDGGLGDGTGATTTFFGVSGRGKRVGYVVDKSGSMGIDGRMRKAKGEIIQSITALPDFASVCVAMFDDDFQTIDRERGFVKCRDASMARLKMWVESVAQSGGTNPVPAFQFLFSRTERPDVVFFMSDGEIPPDAADEILRLNRRGPNTVIHCIAFGQAAATAPLRRIASETGGTFSISASRQAP